MRGAAENSNEYSKGEKWRIDIRGEESDKKVYVKITEENRKRRQPRTRKRVTRRNKRKN